MKSITDLFLKYYDETYKLGDATMFPHYSLPIKEGYIKQLNRKVKVDFNNFYSFVYFYKNKTIIIDGIEYSIP